MIRRIARILALYSGPVCCGRNRGRAAHRARVQSRRDCITAFNLIQAHNSSPYLSSGTPTTAACSIAGMREQKLFDLARVDVLAAANDHVFDPAGDLEITVRQPQRPDRPCAASRRGRSRRRSRQAGCNSRSSCYARGCKVRPMCCQASVAPVAGSMIFTSTPGNARPTVSTRSSSGSSASRLRDERRRFGLAVADRDFAGSASGPSRPASFRWGRGCRP